jgi:hypothetical protein
MVRKLIFCLWLCLISATAQAALSIDNATSNANSPVGAVMTGTITTSSTNDLVCVITKWLSTSGTVLSITDAPANLSWAKRAGVVSSVGGGFNNDYDIEEWCAFSSAALTSTDTVTVTATSTIVTNRETIFAVHGVATGANPTCYYDTNASIPSATWQSAATSPISATVSTTNSTDLIVAYTGSTASSYTPPTGYTALVSGGTGGANSAYYKVLSSPLSSSSVSFAYTTGNGGQDLLIDAFQDGSTACGGGPTPAPTHHRGIFG